MKSATTILRVVLPAILLLASWNASAQATMTTSGNWNLATNWTGSDIGDALGENVTINNNVAPTIPTGLTYTVGHTVLSQDNIFTIDASSTLNVGSSGNARNFTTNLNPNLVINGTLEIWGDFIANNNVIFNITGTVRIHGNMQFSGSGTNVTVNGAGNLFVLGNMTGSGNVNFTVNGAVDVAGNVSVGGGSNLNGSGVFTVHGSCSGTPFCSSGILPVELMYFRQEATASHVDLVWATASESDVDYFSLERSIDGKIFSEIGKIASMGNSNSERIYSFTDEKPVAGTSFFRLNEISRNGQKKILSTIKSFFDGSKGVTMYPNPAIREQPISFSLNFSTSEQHEISVFDTRGVLIGKGLMEGEETTLPLSLATGVYIIRITSKNFSTVQRLVVQ